MKKQTAVEWLVEQMRFRKEQGLTVSFYDLEMFSDQAKAMEKEQIIEAFMNGELFGEEKYASDYYKETYGKDESKTD